MNIEELARQAGINTKFWNMGAGSVLFVSFVDGIPRSNFEHYTALVKAEVLEQAAQKCDSEHFGKDVNDACNTESDEAYNLALKHAAEAIRAMML